MTTDLSDLFDHAAAAAAAIKTPHPLNPAEIHAFVIPERYKLEQLDLERYMPTPRRPKGTTIARDTRSFVELVNRHGTDETVIYVDRAKATATAVFDDHHLDAGWREHRCVVHWQLTDAWDRWIRFDRVMLEQSEFAAQIEEGLSEIAKPAGADLLEIAQTLHATKGVTFRSERRLQTGEVKLAYVEDLQTSAGREGDMTIPAAFTLVLPILEGANPVQIEARLRFRLVGQKLSLGYLLDKPAERLKAAVDAEVVGIRGEIDEGIPVINGCP
jgi:uncharacterized protein YfdQ (DUF2303 family)